MIESLNNKIRIIPRLDVKGKNVVKGVHLEGLRVVGEPGKFAHQYYCDGADEIIYMDSVASLYGRNNLHDIVSQAAEQIFIPMTVGGGIRDLDDVSALLKAGADKVAVNTALFKTPELVSRIADRFGTQCMVVSIDVVKREDGFYVCLSDNGREDTGVELMSWVDRVIRLGAGEILLTSVDNEGTGLGYDIELVRRVADFSSVPVIACGGAGNASHVIEAVESGHADAVSIASILHYEMVTRENQNNQTSEGNKAFLEHARSQTGSELRKGITPINIMDLKDKLRARGICIRQYSFAENL